MRVTSAPASSNSLVASAASRALCDPVRIEPAKTRTLGSIGGSGGDGRLSHDAHTVVMAGLVPAISIHWHGLAARIEKPGTRPGMTRRVWNSVLAIDPHARG